MKMHYWFAVAPLLASLAYAAGPTPTSAAAAKATAANNALCQAITPFYWQIGDGSSLLVQASEGVDSTGAPVLATTSMNVASSAKWLYGSYVVQTRGAAANLTAQDINFLHMTSGYTNMGGDGGVVGRCPSSDNPDTVNVCLTLINSVNDEPYSWQDPASIGIFYYDAGHFENHASQFTGIGNTANTSLGRVIGAKLGAGVTLTYSQPLLAGGAYMTPSSYAHMLQHIVAGTLFMKEALGTNPVCTLASSSCTALNSPIPYAWHYSMAHWVEDDPSLNDDGAFSSTGAQGFYPWIEAGKAYYGLIGRAKQGPEGTTQQGVLSAQCGQMIRRAWDTGVQQTGSTRTPAIVLPSNAAK
jgi:hypothetical protein